MFQIKINSTRNTILCILEGRFDPAEAKEYIKKFKNGVDKLSPNFIVITDISEFIPTDDDVRDILRQGTEYAVNHRMGRAIRIVSDRITSKIGNIQFNRAAQDLGYKAEEVSSLEDAKKMIG